MRLYKFLFIAILSIVVSSCKKQDFTNSTLIGKWKLSDVFSGYTNGGDFAWHSYPNYRDIVFKQDSTFEENTIYNNTSNKCVGTYSIQTQTLLRLYSSCQTGTTDFRITEQTPTTLIRDIQVIEGVIREKYIAIP